mmetsp:Transcript_26098/g.76535  ORF Transcript_26098/g.76535 Transcript_26098/m.76535 type:complete len:241 (+) Transcript_26098:474-1196(+)
MLVLRVVPPPVMRPRARTARPPGATGLRTRRGLRSQASLAPLPTTTRRAWAAWTAAKTSPHSPALWPCHFRGCHPTDTSRPPARRCRRRATRLGCKRSRGRAMTHTPAASTAAGVQQTAASTAWRPPGSLPPTRPRGASAAAATRPCPPTTRSVPSSLATPAHAPAPTKPTTTSPSPPISGCSRRGRRRRTSSTRSCFTGWTASAAARPSHSPSPSRRWRTPPTLCTAATPTRTRRRVCR